MADSEQEALEQIAATLDEMSSYLAGIEATLEKLLAHTEEIEVSTGSVAYAALPLTTRIRFKVMRFIEEHFETPEEADKRAMREAFGMMEDHKEADEGWPGIHHP